MKKTRILLLMMVLLVSIQAEALYQVVYLKVGEAYACTVTSIISGRTYNWSVSGRNYLSNVYGGTTGSAFMTFIANSPGSVTISCTGTSSGTFANYYDDTWVITIEKNTPKSVSITPNPIDIDAGATIGLTASVSPANAEYSTLTWSSEDESIAKVTAGTGTSATLKAVGIGKTTITCTEDNGKYGTCDVTVWGTNPTGITLSGPETMVTDETGLMTYSFTPETHHSNVIWSSSDPSVVTIDPTGSVTAVSDGIVTITATTNNGLSKTHSIKVNKAPMTLKSSIEYDYVERGDMVELTASNTTAEIRYTLDGTEPTSESSIYKKPIVISKTLTLWAKAFKKGYVTPEVKTQYKVTKAMVDTKFPNKDELYLYQDVNPFVKFESAVSEGPKFSTAKVVCDRTKKVEGDFLANGYYLVFVPKQPLALGHSYTVVLEEGTVITSDGDPNKAMQWSFATGEFIRSITAGYVQAASIRTDNTLLYWGRKIDSYDDGDCMNSSLLATPSEIATDVISTSCGFTHNVFATTDGQTYGWGLQFCGETGAGTSSFLADPVAIGETKADNLVAGGQATAFINEGKLLMAGRNDFGQVGNTEAVAYDTPVEYAISGGVQKVIPGWQTTFALSNDGTLYGWGDNANGLLGDGTQIQSGEPKAIMNNVVDFSLSRWSNSNAAAVTSDGTLYVWGLNDQGQLGNGGTDTELQPVNIMDDVNSVDIGTGFMAAIKSDGSLWMWGDNSFGQLGDGSTASIATPKKVMDDVENINLGDKFAVALKKDGSVWTWGRNDFSQLGNGSKEAYSATPQQILKGRHHDSLEDVEIVNSIVRVKVGGKAVVCATTKPLTADYKTWKWTANDETVATVNSRGVITGVSEGITTITLTVDGEKTATCSVFIGDDSGLIGDVNLDGKVNAKDIVDLIAFIAGKSPKNVTKDSADINADSHVDYADVQLIVNAILNK